MKLMRPFSTLLLTFLVVGTFSGPVLAEHEDSSDMKTVTEGNTAFALELYAKLKEKEGNLFLSPHSISTALAMTYAGARGDTAREMAGALHFALGQKELHPAFARLEAQLKAAQEKGGIELSVANSLWAQKDFDFLEEFLDLTKKNYGAGVHHVDFKTACEAARKEINLWVEQKTREKIKDLIKPGVLNAITRLVLVNAIYFKGDWASQFKKDLTKEASFRLSPEKSVSVPMMNQKQEVGYAENDEMQIIELPYVGNDLSMIVLLPRKVDGLDELENALTAAKLREWTGSLGKKEVIVFLPKFKMTSQFSLEQVLATMGMRDAFSAKADFSGMDGRKDLFISAVIHKAFVDVSEEGTEAAAATAVVMRLTAAPVPAPEFRADHPFLFMIRHNPSGSILFLGRVVNPAK